MNLLSRICCIALIAFPAVAVPLDVEEKRLPKAKQVMPSVITRYNNEVDHLIQRYRADKNELTVTRKVAEDANALWQKAVTDAQKGYRDDRSLYWARLNARAQLKKARPSFPIVDWQRQILLDTLEKASRGMSDIKFEPESQLKVLLTGFDPFLLDKDITQSNPSGVAALALDGKRMMVNGRLAQIETALIPVRFQDFDNGIVESLLTPYLRRDKVDLIVTVSMGRDQFDLERFPGRNRSATAPDNLNIVTGASKERPLPPYLNNKVLNGPEFVEFSLPVSAMKRAQGQWQINDNRSVTTKSGSFEATGLLDLQNEVSVEGSGGGYLSNEISYRSILLRELMKSKVPIGHIHTPKVTGHQPDKENAILAQIQAMLKLALQQQ